MNVSVDIHVRPEDSITFKHFETSQECPAFSRIGIEGIDCNAHIYFKDNAEVKQFIKSVQAGLEKNNEQD